MRPTRWSSVVAFVAAAALSGLSTASAASLGGVAAPDIAAFDQASTVNAPTVLAWENFDGANGTAINNTNPDWGPGVWRSLGGTWTVQGNQASVTSAPLGSINIHVTGVSDAAVEATLHRNGSNTFDAGLLFNDNDYSVLLVRWRNNNNGSIELYKWNNGYTRLARVRNLYNGATPTPASITLRVRTVGSLVEVFIDGGLVLTHTLNAGDTTTFKNAAHDGWGLWAERDATTTFDDFHVDTP